MSDRILSKSQQRGVEAGKLVESTNALPSNQFFETYCNSDNLQNAITSMEAILGQRLNIVTLHAEHLKTTEKDTLDACFSLIEASSAADYKRSSKKWSAPSKRREMVLPDMRYLILRKDAPVTDRDHSQSVCGFISFMITYEDSHEVIYIYEIHLAPEYRGQGIGKVLLEMIEEIGRKVKVEKSMLTVFKSNKRAVQWYDRMGYIVDDFSPGPRVLRNGAIREPSYLILSKVLH